ncbi:hypothetical protein V6574_10060 [Streptomyces sp. SM1P]
MLQCTAVTLLPPDAVLRLTAPGADSPEDSEPYVLCELGEHHSTPTGPHTEHAAYLRPGRTPDSPALWFFWTGSGPERTHRAEPAPGAPPSSAGSTPASYGGARSSTTTPRATPGT